MLLAAILLALSLAVIVLTPAILRRASWQVRYPATALWIWTLAFISGFVFLLGAIASTIFSAVAVSSNSAEENILAFFAGWLGLGALGAIGAYASTQYERVDLGDTKISETTAAIAINREHYEGFTLVTFESRKEQAFAVPHPNGAEIFVSTTLMKLLTKPQLMAVVSHENAHIRWRHHLVLRICQFAEICTPKFLKGGKRLKNNVSLLIELVADDTAAKEVGAVHLANALQKVSENTSNKSMALRAARLSERKWPKTRKVNLPVNQTQPLAAQKWIF